MKTYISLFSSAGVGCYGFKMEGFECVATNELIERRLNVQRCNKKCKYESGYICGDITENSIKSQLFEQVELWRKNESLDRIDVVIATPPCQGMSVANHKKKNDEILRNSLVVESIKIIQTLHPRFFVLENVPAFMKTICTDVDGVNKPISEAIKKNLGFEYSYVSRVINFKDFGACSSRRRTLVIGVANDYANEVSPFELYPTPKSEKTLREVIGNLPSLENFGEIYEHDIYHSFRIYPEHMRKWISDLREGQSAFDNLDDEKKPHKVVDGQFILNKQKNSDKYKRQYWDKVGPCIHTRNDQLASQNTIHPSDDRVFSIRELMLMMTVPYEFKWVDKDFSELNSLSYADKRNFLKKEEIKIRQALGEAVPTSIFRDIANKIKSVLSYQLIRTSEINNIVKDMKFKTSKELIKFIIDNPMNLSMATLSKIAELSNTNRIDNSAYFTSKFLITEIMKAIPDVIGNKVHILEPSVGVGNFVPLILKKFENKEIYLDLIDIDNDSIEIAKALLGKYDIPSNVHIKYIVDDFLEHDFDTCYDFVIGNPPFCKIESSGKKLIEYRAKAKNKLTTNICSFFLDKSLEISKYTALVFPKCLLNTPEFAPSREYISNKSVECIIDFGEKGFPGVLVETIAILINNANKPLNTSIISVTKQMEIKQKQKYIFDKNLPYWVIYRNALFDSNLSKLNFDVFSVFRDRQITNKDLKNSGDIRVLKSRNISDDGKNIVDVQGYDSYIDMDTAKKLSVYSFLERDDVYLTPNMTYKPRVMKKPSGVLVNGSVAILIPKQKIDISEKQLSYFSTNEYREFYQIARNYQTRSLNVDSCSVYFYGLLKEEVRQL